MVKRYISDFDSIGSADGDGWVVSFDDYESLFAQVKALEVYPGRCVRLEIENAALRHRLKKLEEGK